MHIYILREFMEEGELWLRHHPVITGNLYWRKPNPSMVMMFTSVELFLTKVVITLIL